ncbi:MAG: TIR domain-containing protein [Pseudomonadota bacterium]|nr:TIR domain-containing protein [Pseudomonadota bacterium]
MHKYKAFISYSHNADSKLAPSIQRALQRFAKPWYRARACRIFRDTTNLSVSPHAWPDIREALGQSEFLILLASPSAAKSKWVNKEAEYWIENRERDKLLILLTSGAIGWDDAKGDFDWKQTDSLPEAPFKERFSAEPLHLDFSTLDRDQLSIKDLGFLDKIASIASRLHGRPKDKIFGEHLAQHRKTLRLAGAAVLLLVVLLAAAVGLFVQAEQSRLEATEQLAITHWNNGMNERDTKSGEPLIAAHHFARAAGAFERGQQPDAAQNAALAQAVLSSKAKLAAVADHSANIKEAVISRDGLRALTLGADTGVQVWDTSTGKPMGPRLGTGAGVDNAKLSGDETRVLTWGRNLARVWDSETGAALTPLLEHQEALRGAAFSTDGTRVLAWGETWAQVWDGRTGRQLAPLLALDESTESVDFSGDGTRVLAVGKSSAQVWDSTTGDPVTRPFSACADHPRERFKGAAFSTDGRLVLSWCTDTAQVWDIATGKTTTPALRVCADIPRNYSERDLRTPALSPDGKRVLAWCGYRAQVWDTATGKSVSEDPLKHPAEYMTGARFGPGSRYVLTEGVTYDDEGGTSEDSVAVWEDQEGTWRKVVSKSGESPKLSPDETHMITRRAYSDDVSNITKKDSERLPLGIEGIGTSAQFNRDGKRVLAWNRRGAQVWDLETLNRIGPIIDHRDKPVDEAQFSPDRSTQLNWYQNRLEGVHFNPDQSKILTWNRDGIADSYQAWDTRTGKALIPAPLRLSGENSVTLDGSGSRLLSVDNPHPQKDGSARIWDTATGKAVTESLSLAVDADGALFSADHQRVLTWRSASRNDESRDVPPQYPPKWNWLTTEMRIWDSETGKILAPPMAHQTRESVASNKAERFGAAFSGNQQRLLSWGADGSAYTWNLANGKPLGPPVLLPDDLAGASLSTDGSQALMWGRKTLGAAHSRPLWVGTWNGDSDSEPTMLRPLEEQTQLVAFHEETSRLFYRVKLRLFSLTC